MIRNDLLSGNLKIRRFNPGDAVFCFKVRATSFIQEFIHEIGAEAVTAGIRAYMPKDYIRMAKQVAFFIVEEENQRIGFFTLKRISATIAELPLIYIDPGYHGRGIGSQCIRYMEEWILSHWKDVQTVIVDTVIPRYNGAFYEKMGFSPEREVTCDFPDITIKALRLSKNLKRLK